MWVFNIVLLLAVGAVHCSCPGDGLFEEIQGECYYWSYDRGLTANFDQAKTACHDIGLLLGLSVELAEVNNDISCFIDTWFMQAITNKGRNVWLGAEDDDGDGVFDWLTSGQYISTYDPYWGYDEPTNYVTGNRNCLGTHMQPMGRFHRMFFNDMPCEEEHYYVCQMFA